MPFYLFLLKQILIIISISLDSFLIAFTYRMSKIKIPLGPILLMNTICALTFGISILFGTIFQNILSEEIVKWISFSILFLLGITKLLENKIKKGYQKKEIKFAWKNISIILNIYIHTEKADKDLSKDISIKETISLSLALSLDSLGVGLGVGMIQNNPLLLIGLTWIIGLIMILSGNILGGLIKTKKEIDLSWLSGVILVLIALSKLG